MQVLAAAYGQLANYLSPMTFMIVLILGMDIPCVVHTTVFEGMIASLGNSHLMYLAGAIGYLGYVGVMFFRNSVSGSVDFLNLLIWVSLVTAMAATAIFLMLGVYYYRSIASGGEARGLASAGSPMET